MKKISGAIFTVEKVISSCLLCLIAVLVFISAVARTIGFPVNWAQDISLLAFAWGTFLGGDVLARSGGFIRIDMFTCRFPKPVQKALGIGADVLILVFLGILVVYGFILVSQSWTRLFNTLKLSYAWCTLAVPVGSLLLFSTTVSDLIRDIKKPCEDWGRAY